MNGLIDPSPLDYDRTPALVVLDSCPDSIDSLREVATRSGHVLFSCTTTDELLSLPADLHNRIRVLFLGLEPEGAAGLERLLNCFPLLPAFVLTDKVESLPSQLKPDLLLRDASVVLGFLEKPLRAEAVQEALEVAFHFAERRDEVFERHVFRSLPLFLEEPIARVIHDLNNQITGLKGGVDLLNYSLPARGTSEQDNKIHRYMDQFILPSLAQIENLLMSWRRMRESHGQAVLPTDLVEVACRAVRLSAAPGEWDRVQIKVAGIDIGPGVYEAAGPKGPHIWCLANMRHLVSAVAHVVQNAIEATADRPDPIIQISVGEEEGGMVSLCIEDNGSGIDPANASDVWRSFYSTKGKFGLGLALAKQVVDRLQGQVDLTPSVLNGAAVKISLPSARPSDQDAPDGLRPHQTTKGAK